MSKRLLTHALSICLRDSAFALHLRHTTECVLQRVLIFPVKHIACHSEKIHGNISLHLVYTVFRKSQHNGIKYAGVRT